MVVATVPKYKKLAREIEYLKRVEKEGRTDLVERAKKEIEEVLSEYGYPGLEIKVSLEESTPNRLVLYGSIDVYDPESGIYEGFIPFEVIVTPSLVEGFDFRVRGRFGTKYYLERQFVEQAVSEFLEEKVPLYLEQKQLL